MLGSIPLPSYRILYCSPRECRNRKYAFKVRANVFWSSLNLNVHMVSLYTCACRLFIRGCGRTSWALKPRRTCWVGSGLSANQQAWRLMTSSIGEPELSNQKRSICMHSTIHFNDSSRSLDAVPVFRTSLWWEITLKPWSSSTRPRFQNETPRPQQNWAGCRQNRLYWIKTWWELKWRHQSWEEDMRADQCKWSEILQNDTEWRTFNNVLITFST